LTDHEDPLFSEAAEETFDALRARILQLEQEAEAERHAVTISHPPQKPVRPPCAASAPTNSCSWSIDGSADKTANTLE
jgi:hypothetical protein